MADPATETAVYDELVSATKETAMLGAVESLLGWDERTYLPTKAASYRADQQALLSGIIHQHKTAPKIGEAIQTLASSDLASDPNSVVGANIRCLKREYDKKTKVPQELVEALTRATVLGQQSWVEARKNDDFEGFRPQLEEIIRLKIEQAQAVGFEECAYDALLDDYEPEAKTSEVARVLAGLREELAPLVAEIADASQRPDVSILHRNFLTAQQASFGTQAAAKIGFDFDSGRLDVTHHPFCTTLGPNDIRLTTRYDEQFFPSAFFGTLHEAGHGIYEQGLPVDQHGLPAGMYASLGIHESQSRLWENMVGRSEAFWDHFFAPAQKTFSSLADISKDQFYAAINNVSPSLIRVEADEATYNLHIIIRFELEQALVNGECQVADLPAAWNEKYEHYLGITPPNNADGVLQDVHWSAGLFGYFPTYSLGNLYAAQLFNQAEKDLGDFAPQFAKGEFAPLLGWLRENVHQAGQRWPAATLVEKIAGEPIDHKPLIDYLRGKLAPIYGL
jgi:carboxypeptidase Taq